MSFFNATTTTTNTSTAAEKDVEVVDPPTDGISTLSFSSQADYLAVGSWDNSVGAEIRYLNNFFYSLMDVYRRSASMKLERMDRRRERLCTSIKGPSWTYAGIKYGSSR